MFGFDNFPKKFFNAQSLPSIYALKTVCNFHKRVSRYYGNFKSRFHRSRREMARKRKADEEDINPDEIKDSSLLPERRKDMLFELETFLKKDKKRRNGVRYMLF